MKTLSKFEVPGSTKVVVLVTTKEWFGGSSNYISSIYNDFYIVGEYNDFHDGEKSNIEGMETIAMCRDRRDADKIYLSHIFWYRNFHERDLLKEQAEKKK